jgi:subtilisin-like proprotein convertase family protein
MRRRARHRSSARAIFVSLLLLSSGSTFALQVQESSTRFDALVVANPTHTIDVDTTPIAALTATEPLREAWDGFRSAHGQAWAVYLDRRSGAPLLVEGPGLPWPIEPGASVDAIATSLLPFIEENKALLLADVAQLALDRNASGSLNPDVWQIVFGRVIGGVPVADERYVFTIGHGNLMSFGASRWSRIDADPRPDIDAFAALDRLAVYMGLTSMAGVTIVRPGSLQLIALPQGSALVWRLALQVDGEPGTWEALVDAHTGAIRSFADVNDYAAAKGGVYPVSSDGVAPGGIEQVNFPMPFAKITIGASSQTTNSSGVFSCTPNFSPATTTLAGPYISAVDTCGAVSQSISCDNDLALGGSSGTDCAVPAGSSAGNTHAARTSFYHLNRIAEHARAWLPGVEWLQTQLTENVNLNLTCNAFWNGASVNFFRSSANCRNSGENASIVLHEWGHGLDENDGGGKDRPGEAYADITAFVTTHASCVGRGFRATQTCVGYGDTCLTCTGIRDQDWDQHASHTPATPAGFVTNQCTATGTGPCGREAHCESHVSAEALWDLAVRDLPASGLDQASSWQLVDKLWFKSRLGSGGNAYNCSLPSSDGCGAASWFTKLRTIDDDDGNLANGTPHAAAIFAAFNRHKIACGAVGDASNQNSTICPTIGGTVLTGTAGSSSAHLTWTPVSGASFYRILRNDQSCDAGSTIVDTVAGTTFTDTGLANGLDRYYRVQPRGFNALCEGRVSNCQVVTPQQFNGSVKLDAPTYTCSSHVAVSVVDANIGAGITTVKVTSATEPAGEIITLTQVAPGSASYSGTIILTGGAPAADGLVSVAHGDTITATYIDANDGLGGINVARQASAAMDCAGPVISNVRVTVLTPQSARITWSTDEPATSVVRYGPLAPPASTNSNPAMVATHSFTVTGLSGCSSYVFSVASTDALGNTAEDNAAGAYHPFATGRYGTQTYSSSDTPVYIPDNNVNGGFSTIVAPDVGIVQNMTVKVNITHPYVSDLDLRLNTPDPVMVTLVDRRGFEGDDFINTVFDNAAATPIAAGAAPFTGTFRPDAPLPSLVETNSAVSWQLGVVDHRAGDEGFIKSWTLFLTVPVACGPTGVRPVADGSFGTAMTGSRADAVGSLIDVTWDVSTCSSADHHILYGDLANVASASVSGSFCDLGTSGSASWPGVPAGDLWFVVVGDDDAATEGSWGTDGRGAQRGSGAPSGQCGITALNSVGACP